ncbi:EAL domain-containing protein [Sulfurospirillum sp. 1612]|uniref:EAL domain-containing protein n=1 Tax=Sulfurospirillum sp. 1612 TaxID=3094835 RepID=UPI002F958B77
MGTLIETSLLYIEDDDAVRNSIARSLSLIFKQIAVAKNGLEALEFLKSHEIDILITDIKMPQMDGLTLIQKIRDLKMQIPVIITSAFNETEYIINALELKVDKFINKPIKISELIDVITVFSEIIQNKKELKIKQQQLENYKKAIEQTNLILTFNRHGVLTSINKEFATYFHIKPIENNHIINQASDLFQEKDIEEILTTTTALNIYNKTIPLYFSGDSFMVVVTGFASVFHHHDINEITLILNDISPIVTDKDNTIQKLYTDDLTQLPNRQKLFKDLLDNQSKNAILIVDIDHFSHINHLFGFDGGDEILVQLANLLKQYWSSQSSQLLYRSDMDHFVLLLNDKTRTNPKTVKQLAMQINNKIKAHTFLIKNDISINLSTTIGASCLGKNDIFTEALISLSAAKSRKISFACFNDLSNLKERFEHNINTQRKIKKALEQDGVINYYQPIVDQNERHIKYESLIRIKDPYENDKILTPYYFLDIAKQSKDYPMLTRKVIENAFRDFGNGSSEFSINLSFEDIMNPETVSFLISYMQQFPEANITIELLESEGIIDIERTLEFCNEVKNYGAKIAIDDFGSGYSSFAYFLDIPLDILKIDGSLVKHVHEYRGYKILESIVNFSQNIGVKTVAEYVEDEKAFLQLKNLGIDMFQGYYFAKPKPFSELSWES